MLGFCYGFAMPRFFFVKSIRLAYAGNTDYLVCYR